VSDSATVVATTCGANFTSWSNVTLWQETRYVMLLLNHSDRNASPPFAISASKMCNRSDSEHARTMVHGANGARRWNRISHPIGIQEPILFRMLK